MKCGVLFSSKNCPACAKVRSDAWRLLNKDRFNARTKKWKAQNKEKVSASGKRYYLENIEKISERKEKDRKENPTKYLARDIKYRLENREKFDASQLKYKSNNKEKIAIWRKAYKQANKGTVKIDTQNRRAKIKESGILSKGLIDKLFKLQRGKCACCGMSLGDNYHIDHIMPLALGGTNTDDNIQLLTAKCNLYKHKKHPVDFMRSRGFLL